MLSLNRAIVALIIFTGLVTAPVTSADRIKDITDVAGVRANKLVGFGLVVGPSGAPGLQSPVFWSCRLRWALLAPC